MKNFLIIISVAGIMVLAGLKASIAEVRHLVSNTGECPAGIPTPPCYTSFSEAITNAVAGDSLEIGPGTYATGNVTLNKSVSIRGIETARTFLDGGGTGTILTVENITTAMDIRRLTFIQASATGAGILVRNTSSSVTISNNVFQAGESSSGVETTGSPSTEITNNTFYGNLNGIVSDTTAINITNNIFYQNSGGTAITPSTMDLNAIKNNLFFGGTIGPAVIENLTDPAYKGNIVNSDPLFVNPTARDFHLKSGSPAKDKGDGTDSIDATAADIGAYGGGEADKIPFPVSGLVVTSVTGSSPASVTVTWSPNTSYMVGGYFVYFGTVSGQYGTPIDTMSTAATHTIPNLVSSVSSAPTGSPAVSSTVSNGALTLDWATDLTSRVTGSITGFEIRYDTSLPVTAPPTTPPSSTVNIDVGNSTSRFIDGLANGTSYHFIVTPYTQSTYYFAVKPYYSFNKSFISQAFSNEASASLEDRVYGSPGTVSDFPEAIAPYPQLANNGCFIATAAYGYYSAPQVQALRQFRDRYLLTNGPGRMFVGWYYRHGPRGAQFINDHPWSRPMMQIALMPLVAGAFLMVHTSLQAKMIVILVIGLLFMYFLFSRYFFRSGGVS